LIVVVPWKVVEFEQGAPMFRNPLSAGDAKWRKKYPGISPPILVSAPSLLVDLDEKILAVYLPDVLSSTAKVNFHLILSKALLS
jgi:hypothetical protein